MAGCSDSGCNCVIQAGPGASVAGSGTATSPYILSADNALGESFSVQDSTTVNLTLFGSGTPEDRFILRADATMPLTGLSDINDPEGGPSVGESPVWNGSAFEFKIPSVAPAGTVNVSTGITGTGAAATPLKVALVGTNEGGPTTGLEVYADSAGNLRALPGSGLSVDWSNITNKPTTFPPSAHSQPGTTITGQDQMLGVGGILGHAFYIQQADPGNVPDGSIWISW
jgi:hypothetical protein